MPTSRAWVVGGGCSGFQHRLDLASDQLEQMISLPNQPGRLVVRWLNLLADLQVRSGADYETIQTQLGLTNGALRGLLHRGLKLLRAKLPRDFEINYGERGASAS